MYQLINNLFPRVGIKTFITRPAHHPGDLSKGARGGVLCDGGGGTLWQGRGAPGMSMGMLRDGLRPSTMTGGWLWLAVSTKRRLGPQRPLHFVVLGPP